MQKKSAIELANDLETFVKEPAKRGSDWGKSYPQLKNRKVDYNAMRLARTSINHSYQTATIQSSTLNPFVDGIKWRSANIHGRTCELCMSRDGKIYDAKDVPLDHANGLCTMIPYIKKELSEISDELRDWIRGGNNPKLDKWYAKMDFDLPGTEIIKGVIKEEIVETIIQDEQNGFDYDEYKRLPPSERRAKVRELGYDFIDPGQFTT